MRTSDIKFYISIIRFVIAKVFCCNSVVLWFSGYEHLVVQRYNGKYKDATKLSLNSGQNMTATDITFVKIRTAVSKSFHNSVSNGLKFVHLVVVKLFKSIRLAANSQHFHFALRVSIPLLYLQYGPLACNFILFRFRM